MRIKNKLNKLISRNKNTAKIQSPIDIANNEIKGAVIISANKDSTDTDQVN